MFTQQISKEANQQEINIKEYDYNSDESDSIDQISDENHTYYM